MGESLGDTVSSLFAFAHDSLAGLPGITVSLSSILMWKHWDYRHGLLYLALSGDCLLFIANCCPLWAAPLPRLDPEVFKSEKSSLGISSKQAAQVHSRLSALDHGHDVTAV